MTHSRSGFILLVTMIVLVVLATLTAGLSVRLAMAKRRQQYMIEYQRARYGLDSAMKYILKEMPRQRFTLQDRQDQPDFSDLFVMNRDEFAEFIALWSETATDEQVEAVLKKGASMTQSESINSESMLSNLMSLFGGGGEDANELAADLYNPNQELYLVELDPNDVVVPGPYGPPWPYVIEPIELEIGPARVTITIEDENAKMPLTWLVTSSDEANKQAQNALQTFCEWMSWDEQQLQELETAIGTSMDKIHDVKAFKLDPSPILLKTTPKPAAKPTASSRNTRVRRTRRTTSQAASTATASQRPAIAHTTDFAKLFHSSMVDQELLARPLPDTGDRIESPLKYLSLWGAQRVNINTAPRHVLQAAFMLAIDSFEWSEFAQQVIDRRKEKPFQNINELKELGQFDTKTMDTIKRYMTTTSTFFQVRVTSRSGNARTSAVATVVKEGKKTQELAILYEP